MSNLRWWKKSCVVFVLCATTAVPSSAQTFAELHREKLRRNVKQRTEAVEAAKRHAAVYIARRA